MEINGLTLTPEHGWYSPNSYCLDFKEVPNKSGVYVFLAYKDYDFETADLTKPYLAYIGSSINLSQRYKGHEVKDKLYENHKYVKCFFKEAKNYRELEKELIKAHRPKLNKVYRDLYSEEVYNG